MEITIYTPEPIRASSLPDARMILAHRGIEATGLQIEAPAVGFKCEYGEFQLARFNSDVRKLKRGLGL